jgi:hypothetical protein
MIVWEDHPKVAVHDLLADVAFEFPEVPSDALARYALLAATEACRNADLDRRSCLVHTVPHVTTYLLDPLDSSEVVAVLGATQIDGADRGRRIRRFMREPKVSYSGIGFWYDPPERTVHIVTGSLRPGVFRVEFSAAPARDSCMIPASFASEHLDILLDGIRAKVYELPDRPWFSLQFAAEYARRFRRGYGEAKVDRMTGGQRGMFRMSRRKIL